MTLVATRLKGVAQLLVIYKNAMLIAAEKTKLLNLEQQGERIAALNDFDQEFQLIGVDPSQWRVNLG